MEWKEVKKIAVLECTYFLDGPEQDGSLQYGSFKESDYLFCHCYIHMLYISEEVSPETSSLLSTSSSKLKQENESFYTDTKKQKQPSVLWFQHLPTDPCHYHSICGLVISVRINR